MKTAIVFAGTILVLGFVFAACRNPVLTVRPLTGTVTIDGTPQVGKTLTANITNLDISGNPLFQWRRGNTLVGYGRTYIPTPRDLGETITVVVFATNHSNAIRSEPTDTVFRRNDGTVHIYYEDFLQNQILPVFISENTPVNITLYEPTLYDSIEWWRSEDGDSILLTRDDSFVSGNHDETLTVNANLFHHEFGIHFIVVKVHVDGVEYSKVITVKLDLDPLPSSAWGFENQGGAD